ncbi:hypothetical protein VPH35_081688 [Triticum aestivum]
MTLSISGPRELTGAVDLISQYKLQPHHDFFCKRPLPFQSQIHITFTMLSTRLEYLRDRHAYIQPFDMETLGQAFQLRETAPVDLPSDRSKDKDKDKDKKKDKHHEKKRKHEGTEDSADVHKHKKSKSSKTDEMGNGLS